MKMPVLISAFVFFVSTPVAVFALEQAPPYPTGTITIDPTSVRLTALPNAATLVRRSPASAVTLAPGAAMACTLWVKNIGASNWTSAYQLKSVDSTGTTAVASPLADHWRGNSQTTITVASAPTVLAENGPPNAANSTKLSWHAAGDDGYIGQASSYDLRISTSPLVGAAWSAANRYVVTTRPSPSGVLDTVRVIGLHGDSTYYYSLRSADEVINWSLWSNVSSLRAATATGQFNFSVQAPATPGRYVLTVALYDSVASQFFSGPLTTFIVTVPEQGADLSGPAFQPIAGRFDSGVSTDVGLYRPDTGTWSVATSSLASFNPSATPWQSTWAPGTSGTYVTLVGDFNGDGRSDVCAFKPSTGSWYVAVSNGSGFQDSGLWRDVWAPSSSGPYVPLVGDFNGDGKTDIGVYQTSTGRWYTALSTGTAFVGGDRWRDAWALSSTGPYQAMVGDFNGDGRSDVCAFKPSTGSWYVATSNAVSFQGGGLWRDAFAQGAGLFRPIIGDFNADGQTDICAYQPATGQWSVSISTGSVFVDDGLWLDSWGRITTAMAGQPVTDVEDQATSLDFLPNTPNPFVERTTLRFNLPAAALVDIEAFDLQGRRMAVIAHQSFPAGRHSVDWPARSLAPGMYLCRLRTPYGERIRRVIRLP